MSYPGSEVYHSIEKSKRKNGSKILVLGDSVGKQIFSNTTFNDTINSLACNQAVGLVGQYILLNNYVNVGNSVDTVFLIMRPFSFRNNLDQKFTYHYFLKPFYRSEYSFMFTETVFHQIRKIPYNQFSKIPHILATSWAPEFMSEDGIDYTFLSPISVEYLMKIKELSKRYQFKIIILPTPLSIEKKYLIDNMDRKEIVGSGLENEFAHYFQNIVYLDSAQFSDGSHLLHPEYYTRYYKSKFMN